MGVHWAQEGSVAHRLHQLTKQRVFEGPGLQTAQEVSAEFARDAHALVMYQVRAPEVHSVHQEVDC